MKAKYPLFLSKNPTILGLNFIDLIIIGIGLICSMTFSVNSLWGTVLTIFMILLNKMASKYLDLKAWLFGSKVSAIDWIDFQENGGRQ